MTVVADPHPNTVAERISGRNYVSFSALRTYAGCPLRYFFRYVQGLPEETISASLAFGGGIHSAIELWFNAQMAGEPPPDHETLVSEFWDSWRCRNEEAAIRFGRNEDINTIAELADRLLDAFRQSDLAWPDGRVIGIEEEVRGTIVPGVPDLLARIDLIVETTDALVITDFKTSRSRWSAAQVEDQAEQLLLYSELARQFAPGKELRLEFAVVTKAKNPIAERHQVSIDRNRTTRTRQVVQRVWSAIESGHFYPAPSPLSCPSCPFRDPCRAWTG